MLLTNSTSWVELELTQYLQNPTSILLRKDRKPSNSDSTEIQKIFKIWNSQFLQSKISKLNLQKCCSLIFQLIKTGNFTDLIQASSQKIVPEEQLLWSYLFKKITLHNQFLFLSSLQGTPCIWYNLKFANICQIYLKTKSTQLMKRKLELSLAKIIMEIILYL